MTFPSEILIKQKGKWLTLLPMPVVATLEELDQIYADDRSDEDVLKIYHAAMEAKAARQAARQAELN